MHNIGFVGVLVFCDDSDEHEDYNENKNSPTHI